MFRAVFLDLDGTLLNSQKEVSERTLHILAYLKHKGIEIILSSGRSNKSLEYIARNRINKKEQIVRFIISNDGALIKDIEKNQIIFQKFLEESLVVKIIDCSNAIDGALYVITDHDFYEGNNENKSQIELDERYMKDEFYHIKDALTKLTNQSCLAKVTRILLFTKTDTQKLKRLQDILKSKNLFQISYGLDYHDYWLLLISKKCSKATALSELCEYLDIPLTQTIAFGDAENDREMLHIAGKGIAMKNAKKDLGVKNISDYTNEEDGVGRMLEKMLKNNEL